MVTPMRMHKDNETENQIHGVCSMGALVCRIERGETTPSQQAANKPFAAPRRATHPTQAYSVISLFDCKVTDGFPDRLQARQQPQPLCARLFLYE